jgi:hypothetical protein
MNIALISYQVDCKFLTVEIRTSLSYCVGSEVYKIRAKYPAYEGGDESPRAEGTKN